MAKELPELNKQSPDDVLMLHLQRRNPFAFELLYERYRLNVISFARRMLRDDEKAKDAVQEAFLRVISRRDTFKKGKRVSPWLFRIVANVCIDELRKNKFKGEMTTEEMHAVSASPENGPAKETEKLELEQAVKRAFDKLDPEHKAIVIMQKYHGMNYGDIADSMEKKSSWVKWHIKLAYDALAKELKIFSEPSCSDHKVDEKN